MPPDTKKKSHYDTLGVLKTAKGPEIKRAYRRKSRESHPDLGGSNAVANLWSAFIDQCLEQITAAIGRLEPQLTAYDAALAELKNYEAADGSSELSARVGIALSEVFSNASTTAW
jgi:DnaJ-class molecular chaperone